MAQHLIASGSDREFLFLYLVCTGKYTFIDEP